jgi:hypothetical protein
MVSASSNVRLVPSNVAAWPGGRVLLFNSTFAETLCAGARIDFTARFCWLLNLGKPDAVAGGTNRFFSQNFMRFFHALNSFNKRRHSVTPPNPKRARPTVGEIAVPIE